MDFPQFSNLPTEIRLQIWQQALSTRIIRWYNKDERNVFIIPRNSIPLLGVSHESQDAAFRYAGYRFIWPDPKSDPFYFSPRLDWLLFDPTWFESDPPHPPHPSAPSSAQQKRQESMNLVLWWFKSTQNLMVHPNWSGVRARPLVLFGTLASVRNVLVAADEKSIGPQSKVLMESTWDIRSYYQKNSTRVPYIAVGCLGWTGDDRWSMQHGDRDTRELIAVFENYAQMHIYKKALEKERRRFTEQRIADPKLFQNLRSVDVSHDTPANVQDTPSEPGPPPAYWEVVDDETQTKDNSTESNPTPEEPPPREVAKKGLGLSWREFMAWRRSNEDAGSAK